MWRKKKKGGENDGRREGRQNVGWRDTSALDYLILSWWGLRTSSTVFNSSLMSSLCASNMTIIMSALSANHLITSARTYGIVPVGMYWGRWDTMCYCTIRTVNGCTLYGHKAVQYDTVRCSGVQYSIVQYNTVQDSITQYSAVTIQYSTVRYGTVQSCSPPKS